MLLYWIMKLSSLLWCCIVLRIIPLEGFAPKVGTLSFKRHDNIQVERIHRIQHDKISTIEKQCSNIAKRKVTMYNLGMQEVMTSVFRNTGQVPIFQAFAINVLLFNIVRNKLLSALTPSGYIHAMALGTMLWSALGLKGWMYCVSYLVMGQLVTKIGFADKEKRGIAESRGGRRGPENVWGSAATSLFCAMLAAREIRVWKLNKELFLLGYVAALATKLADTFASEIGKAYGKTAFLITTLERVQPGTEGAVSAEGTAAAFAGGLILSIFGCFLGLVSLPAVAISTAAAFIATNAESFIGATLQGKKGFGFLTNEVVNFVNTLIGATIAMGTGSILFNPM